MNWQDQKPCRFRIKLDVKRPFDAAYRYGCYFPTTDLCISDMGARGTGKPPEKDVEWLDTNNKEE